MTQPSPLQIVRPFLKALEQLDYEAAMIFVADRCEYVNPPPLPVAHGPDGMRSLLEPFFAPTLHNEFRVLREAEHGSSVFIERLDRHQLADRWVELPVTGVFEIQDGKIVYWRDYFDAATILSVWPAS
ncbi:limonene-1,2-epoxide hydrolase family protein [Phenylobacterium sp.]|uniref:limonene-1,2-epoxide hydrolase family protein n=1 Tax=Phenylobacterium sp. TaxID=1871053 RepID=UPI00272F6A47|nr:limonene-1,2-epoxide hydrolase family protein [Phenylobacterium sp.]MDP1617387.1 limonene-1,2-epoxide hydrolase family protein [Phenylobacterium sp.]MDP1985919.1 limonene-1,2-epoxide hydrolase family protein [Phenylobacterium sp.]